MSHVDFGKVLVNYYVIVMPKDASNSKFICSNRPTQTREKIANSDTMMARNCNKPMKKKLIEEHFSS